jgi:hypothetical protein
MLYGIGFDGCVVLQSLNRCLLIDPRPGWAMATADSTKVGQLRSKARFLRDIVGPINSGTSDLSCSDLPLQLLPMRCIGAGNLDIVALVDSEVSSRNSCPTAKWKGIMIIVRFLLRLNGRVGRSCMKLPFSVKKFIGRLDVQSVSVVDIRRIDVGEGSLAIITFAPYACTTGRPIIGGSTSKSTGSQWLFGPPALMVSC